MFFAVECVAVWAVFFALGFFRFALERARDFFAHGAVFGYHKEQFRRPLFSLYVHLITFRRSFLTASGSPIEMTEFISKGLRFNKPDELTAREMEMNGVFAVRLGAKDIRMEITVLHGDLGEIAKIASGTKISLYPTGSEPAQDDLRTVARLLLGALEADVALATGAEVSDKEEREGKTARGLEFFESSFSAQNGEVIESSVIILSGAGARSAVVAFRANKAAGDRVRRWKSIIQESLEFI